MKFLTHITTTAAFVFVLLQEIFSSPLTAIEKRLFFRGQQIRRHLDSSFVLPDKIHDQGEENLLSFKPLDLASLLAAVDGTTASAEGGIQTYQDNTECSAEFSAIQACAIVNGASNDQFTSCLACMEASLPTVDATSCNDYKEFLCVAVGSCTPCGPCVDAINAYLRCYYPLCPSPCPDDPEDITTKCQNRIDMASSCLAAAKNITEEQQENACLSCATSGGPSGSFPDPFTCPVAETNLCFAPEQCGCGPTCSPLVTDAVSCLVWCDPTCCSAESDPCQTNLDCCSGLSCSKTKGTCSTVNNTPPAADCGETGMECQKRGDCCTNKCVSKRKKKTKGRKRNAKRVRKCA